MHRFSPLAEGGHRGFWQKSLVRLEYGDIKFELNASLLTKRKEEDKND